MLKQCNNITKYMKGLFVGLNTIDIKFYTNGDPALNKKNRIDRTRIDIGGPATNAAIAFAKLGGKSILITAIGKHDFKEYIFKELYNSRIEIIDIADEKRISPSFSGIITNLKNGERTVLSDYSVYDDIKSGHEFPEDFDVCLMDGFLMKTAQNIAEKAKHLGKPVVLDGGSWKTGMEMVLKYIDCIICSADFYAPGCTTHDENIGYLHNRGIRNVAITRGGDSIIASQNRIKTEIPVKKVDVLDTMGAGDVFHGAYCLFAVKKNNFIQALELASVIASESCKYYGTKEWHINSDYGI